MTRPLNQPLYKVVAEVEWREAEAKGSFHGSGIDEQDGFIHLSAADQVVETVTKHFAAQRGLLLVTVNASKLGTSLRWEPSRGGADFPHVYGVIPMAAVERVDPLPLGEDGVHQFPF